MSWNFRAFITALLLFAGVHPLWAVNVTSFSPPLGGVMDQVTINGSGFYPGTLVVRFNGTQDPTAQATADNGTVIQARVPSGAMTGPISVSVNGGAPASSAQDFTVVGPGPYITNFSPFVGSAGRQVLIDGVHFTTATNAYFAGKAGVNFFVQSEYRIQVDAPPGVTSGPISVRSPQGTFTSSNFLVAPVITAFSAATGRAGTNVVLSGTNFLGATNLLFGTFAMNLSPPTNNLSLTVSVPLGATTGPLRINTPAGSYTTSSNFIVQPTIFGFSPGAGPVGTNVTITGANLNVGTPTVRFNGVASTSVSNISFGQLTAVVPAGATTGPISITTSDGSHTNASKFFLPAAITSFTPTNSAPGTTVTVTGQNLLGATNVSFGGAAANFTAPTNNTTLQASVPTNFATGPISVTTPAGTATSSRLFYAAPIVSGFTPTHGLPGTNVTINGSNFLGATHVKFNGLDAFFIAPTNNTAIQAIVPTNAQTGPITVVAPAGSNTSAGLFVLDYNSDLALRVTAAPDPVFVGSNLVYNLMITNNGPFVAPNVTLTNTLPASVTLKSATTSQGSLVTNNNPIVGILGSIPTGGSVAVTLTVTPQTAGTIINIGSVTTTNTDPTLANNGASTTTTVLPLPVLSIRLSSTNSIRIAWPVVLTNFVLEYRPSLAANSFWSNATTAPVISGSEDVVIETLSAAARYYRLRK